MPNDPILHMLGLARKAGRLEIGEEPVAGGPLYQGGAGLRPGPGQLRYAGPDGRGLRLLPGAEALRPGPGEVRPRRPAAEGEGRQDPPAAEREAPAREEPAGGNPPPPRSPRPPGSPPARPGVLPASGRTVPNALPAPAVFPRPVPAAVSCPASSGIIPKKRGGSPYDDKISHSQGCQGFQAGVQRAPFQGDHGHSDPVRPSPQEPYAAPDRPGAVHRV